MAEDVEHQEPTRSKPRIPYWLSVLAGTVVLAAVAIGVALDGVSPGRAAVPLRVANSGLPCDIDQVLAAKCRRCHSDPTQHDAPFALLTWQQIQRERMGEPLYETMSQVIKSNKMPLALEDVDPPVQPLLPDERALLLAWLDRKAPKGECQAPE